MSFKRIIKNVQGLFWRNSVTNGDNAGVMSLLSTYGTPGTPLNGALWAAKAQ
jgi:hypothetical protein